MFNSMSVYMPLHIVNIGIPLIMIPIADIVLCRLFGPIARWFQLHSFVNFLITIVLFRDILDFYTDPLFSIKYFHEEEYMDKCSNIFNSNSYISNSIYNYNKYNNYNNYNNYNIGDCLSFISTYNKLDSYFIIILHLYHALTFCSLTKMDYIHHIVFVGCGVIPSAIYIKSNIARLGFVAGCGFTGIIEYASLALVKNGKMTSLFQKRLNSLMYSYIRCPLAIFGCAFNYVFYASGLLPHDNPYMVFYINLMMYINSTFYSKLTIENYAQVKGRYVADKHSV